MTAPARRTGSPEKLPPCIGYGERDCRKGNPSKHCKNRADTPARLWCSECEAERRKAISGQFATITEGFDA